MANGKGGAPGLLGKLWKALKGGMSVGRAMDNEIDASGNLADFIFRLTHPDDPRATGEAIYREGDRIITGHGHVSPTRSTNLPGTDLSPVHAPQSANGAAPAPASADEPYHLELQAQQPAPADGGPIDLRASVTGIDPGGHDRMMLSLLGEDVPVGDGFAEDQAAHQVDAGAAPPAPDEPAHLTPTDAGLDLFDVDGMPADGPHEADLPDAHHGAHHDAQPDAGWRGDPGAQGEAGPPDAGPAHTAP